MFYVVPNKPLKSCKAVENKENVSNKQGRQPTSQPKSECIRLKGSHWENGPV